MVGLKQKLAKSLALLHVLCLIGLIEKKDGILPPSKRKRDPYKIEDEKLKSYIQEHPDNFLREISEAFKVSIAAVFYACKRLKITLKKRHHSTKKGMNQKEKSFKKS
jgi:transposase